MARKNTFVLERGMKSPLAHVEEAVFSSTIDAVDAAVRGGKCGLAFQPVVHAKNPDRPAFYEGLIRIFDPSNRVIPARDFIARVEDTETGRQIDCVALKKTLRTLEKVPGLQLSLNVSARSIGYAPWTDKLYQALRRKPDLVKRMTIEISEKSVMQLPEITARFVNDLSKKGVRFLLDDFGAGKSAFQDLRDIGFGMLKIDGRYIQGIAQNAENQGVVLTMVSLGQFMEKRIIATRVEDKDDMQWLQRAGIDAFQGYLFGVPTLNPEWERSDDSAQAQQ